jgi:hypothetical protein
MNSFQMVQIRKALEVLLPHTGDQMTLHDAALLLQEQGFSVSSEVVRTIAQASSTQRFVVEGDSVRREGV